MLSNRSFNYARQIIFLIGKGLEGRRAVYVGVLYGAITERQGGFQIRLVGNMTGKRCSLGIRRW